MIVHMVLFKVKKGLRKAKVAQVMEKVGALREMIAGIRSYSWGPYASPEGLNSGFTHGFCMTLESAKARDAYLTHPEHEKVKAAVLEILDGGVRGVIAFDYEA